MEMEERFQRLSDELQQKDRERERAFETRRSELEAKYEIKLNELRKTELVLENSKVELENTFRSKLERLRDEDAQHVRTQKERLEQYFAKLNDKFQKMVEQHKRQQDAESLVAQERSRELAERHAQDEVTKRAEFLKTQHAHETELLSAIASLRDQITTLEGQHKASRAEVMTLQAKLVTQEGDFARRSGDQLVLHSQELSSQGVSLSSEIASRDSLIGELRRDLALKDRDSRVLEEQIRSKAEVELQIKYLKIQQEFEQSVFAQAESRKQSVGHQIDQAREELAKKEREMMDQILKLRKEQELELAQKRVNIEKEANDRYQKLQNEMFENERKREVEKAVQSAELEEKHERLVRKMEEEYQLRQEKVDKQLVDKERKMRAEFRELEKNIELEKTHFTVQLQQQYDQKLRELESSMVHVENEKLSYAQNLMSKFDKLRKEDSIRMDEMKKRLTDYEMQLIEQFQKLQAEHTRLVEAEGAERYRALRDALHAANARDAQHAETLAKQHAAQDAEVAAQLAHINELQRELELKASQAQGDANALRARLAELTAAHQTQLADQSAVFNAQISELRAMMTSEVSARDRRVAQLSEQLAVHDRESETALSKHKQDAEYKLARKYELIHKDMRQQLLTELSEALEDKEKLLREQEEAMRKEEMEMLKRMHQMQDEIVAAERQRDHDRTKYKAEIDQQFDKRVRQAEREIQLAKEAFETELIVKHQKLQTEVLEKDRERDQLKEAFRRDLMKKSDEKLAELRERETLQQKERMDFEASLREKYDMMKREDYGLIQEERKRLEEYEKEIFRKFQITTTEYRRKVDDETKERVIKEKEELEVRTAMLAELKQKKAEFDREMSTRQQKMQDELLERERLKEADYLQKQLQLEDRYQQKSAELRDIQMRMEISKREFELQLIQKFDKNWEDNAHNLKAQRKQLEESHAFLLSKFQTHLKEHQSLVAAGALEHSQLLAEQAKHIISSHDQTISQVLNHREETEAVLRGLRDRVRLMEDEYAAVIAENASEKAAQITLRADLQQERDNKIKEYEDILASLRLDLQDELRTREEHIRVLEEQVGKLDDERASWEVKTRVELEKRAARAQREAYKDMESRLLVEAEENRKAQEDMANERNAGFHEKETLLLARIKKQREDLESEYLKRKGEIEREKFGRLQSLQEEHQHNEKEREIEKLAYFKDLETKYEDRLKQLRDREKEIDSEKVTFERDVIEKYMSQKEEDLKSMRTEKQQWDKRDQEIHHDFVQSINDFKRQLESDAKERADLWEQLLHHDKIELELTKQKENMEQMYIRKHQKLIEETSQREAELAQNKSQYMKEVDVLLEHKSQALRDKEEKLENDKVEYEKHLRELNDKRQEEDKTILSMHKQRILDYEKNLYEKFQKMVDNQKDLIEQEFEERQTRQHNLIKNWSEETLSQQRDQRRQQSEVERGYEDSIKMLHDHIQELENRTHESTRTLARLEAESIINTSNLASSHHQQILALSRESQTLKAEADRLLAERERSVLNLQEKIATMNRHSAEQKDLAEIQIETRLRQEYDKAQLIREKNLLDQVSSMHQTRHEQQMKERIEFENELRLHYEQLQLDSEKRVREWISDVVGQYAEKGQAARAQMEVATRSSIESMISARLGAEEGMREEWDKFTRTIHEKYESLLTGLQSELVDLREKEETRRLDAVTGKESDFHKQATMEKSIQDKYEKILKTQQELWAAQQREIEEQMRRNLHEANTDLVEQERVFTQQKIAFEQELRSKYVQLVAEHQVTREQAQTKSLEQEVDHMQAKMQLEKEKTRVWEEVERRCREEFQEKYTQLLADVEAHWKKEATNREARVHAQLKQHYESLVSTKQQQVELLMQLNNDVDQAERSRWQQVVNELKQRHNEMIYNMDEKIKSKYDVLLKEYEKQYQMQLQQYEAAALAKGGTGGDRIMWEKKLRRCKAAFSKWKYDYQVQTQQRYESIISELHAKYGDQVNYMAHAAAAAKEKELEASVAARQKEVKSLDMEQVTITGQLGNKQTEGRVAVLKASVLRLWDALSTDQEGRQRFFSLLHQASPNVEKVIHLYENELARLNDKLQLMQSVTRREFVKHRLECLDKFEESTQESITLREELEQLNHQLRIGLPTYQRQYNEPFLYKNQKAYELDS